jgi:hypothetical protein
MKAKINTKNLIGKRNHKSVTLTRDPTDYTAWHRKLWEDKSVEEISQMAMKRRKNIND